MDKNDGAASLVRPDALLADLSDCRHCLREAVLLVTLWTGRKTHIGRTLRAGLDMEKVNAAVTRWRKAAGLPDVNTANAGGDAHGNR